MGQLPKPLSNEELQRIREKAQAKPAAKPATAEDIAYETGIRGLGPVVQRIESLEKQVKEALARIEKLESARALDADKAPQHSHTTGEKKA